MTICNNCGVELGEDLKQCPLCGARALSDPPKEQTMPQKQDLQDTPYVSKHKYLLQRLLWQVTSVILFSCILSTLSIDIVIHKGVTWSVYPVTVCTIIFSYVSLFAFWHTKKIYRVLVGLLISSLLFFALDILSPQEKWPLQLGLPLLVAINLIAVLLMGAIKLSKHRDLNIVAYACVAISLLCISVEGIISLYSGTISLRWSVIVAACMLPVTAVLFFMHYRIKKNPDMERIFHT